MKKFTQKYTIICLLEDIDEGFEFPSNSWPLHTTLVDTFAIEWDKEALESKFEEIANISKSVTTKATKEAYFGPAQNIHVVLIEKTDDLVAMHYNVVNSLKQGGVKFNDPQYNEEGFLPHSTVQAHARIKPNATVKCENLALIDMFPNEDPYQRRVLKIVKLK